MHTLCNYSSSLPSHVKACCLAFYMRPYTYLSSTLHDLASVWRSTLSSLLSRSFPFSRCPSPLHFSSSVDSPLFHPVLCLFLSHSLAACLRSPLDCFLTFPFSISDNLSIKRLPRRTPSIFLGVALLRLWHRNYMRMRLLAHPSPAASCNG